MKTLYKIMELSSLIGMAIYATIDKGISLHVIYLALMVIYFQGANKE